MIDVSKDGYAAQTRDNYSPIIMPIDAAGVTEVVFCLFCRDLIVQVDVTGMAAGETITGRVEGSLNNVTFDNLDANDADYTITEDGTYLLNYDGAAPPYIRASGNTAGTAAITIRAFFGVMS